MLPVPGVCNGLVRLYVEVIHFLVILVLAAAVLLPKPPLRIKRQHLSCHNRITSETLQHVPLDGTPVPAHRQLHGEWMWIDSGLIWRLALQIPLCGYFSIYSLNKRGYSCFVRPLTEHHWKPLNSY